MNKCKYLPEKLHTVILVNKKSMRHFERFIKNGEVDKIKKQLLEKKVKVVRP